MQQAFRHWILAAALGAGVWLPAARGEVFQDNFLVTADDGYANVSLKQVFMALPAEFFEVSSIQRADWIRNGRVKFNTARKQIRLEGDGAQMSLLATVTAQTRTQLILNVVTEMEGEQTTWILERGANRWLARKGSGGSGTGLRALIERLP